MNPAALTALTRITEAASSLAWTGVTDVAGTRLVEAAGATVAAPPGSIPLMIAVAGADALAAVWQTPAALAVVAITMLALGWRVRANARRRRRGCGGGACAAVSPDVERLRARLTSKPDR